jgi:MoaA/NifB/PqqE/SkfB family radical SAM enzyme
MRRLELHLTYHCPERCVFCSEQHRMAKFNRFPITWGRVARVLREQAERGVRNVHFTGGEPTIHPRFVDVLKLAQKLGMRTSIGTIGTMLAQPGFAERAVPHLNEALFSLHGPDAACHDPLAGRVGSFAQVVRAIERCLEVDPDFDVYVNTVLTTANLEQLTQTVALADRLGAKLIVISNTTPEGGGLDHYDELAVPLADLSRVLPTVPQHARNAVIRFFGVPMCVLGEHWSLSNDLHWDPRVTFEWVAAPGAVRFEGIYNWAPDRKRVHTEVCGGCIRNAVCMGVNDAYAERWPTPELVPAE